MVPPIVFRLLAHELRSPAAVISGYARMLREGRLDESARGQALAQIERASTRIAVISRQSSELARWMAPDHRAAAPALSVRALVSRAVADSGLPEVSVDAAAESDTAAVLTMDVESLAEAVRSVIEAVRRESLDVPIQILARPADSPGAFDILIGPASRISTLGAADDDDESDVLAIDRGGHGLSLVVAGAVFSAHGSRVWTVGNPPAIARIRLLTATEQVASS